MNSIRILAIATTLAAAGLTMMPAAHAEVFQSKQKAKFCRDLKNIYDNNIAVSTQNTPRGRAAKATAANVRTLAEGNNCNWTTLL